MSRQHIRIIQHLHKLRREQSANMSAGAERDHVRQDHAEYLVAVTRLCRNRPDLTAPGASSEVANDRANGNRANGRTGEC